MRRVPDDPKVVLLSAHPRFYPESETRLTRVDVIEYEMLQHFRSATDAGQQIILAYLRGFPSGLRRG